MKQTKTKQITLIALITVISFLYFFTAKISCDNYFMFVHAKDILTNGLRATYDKISFHSDMPITYQKWLMCLIDYFLYIKGGANLLRAFHLIIYLIFCYFSYRLYSINDNNKTRALFVTLIQTVFMGLFLTTRPQIFTYLFLTVELIALEKYIKTNDKKHLYILPFISFLEIQIHSTNWPILICFVLPYIVLIPKKLNKYFNNPEYKIKPILLMTFLMLLTPLINPYGAESLTYLIKSLFIKEIPVICGECNPSPVSTIITIFILLSVVVLCVNKKKIIESRGLFLLLGTTILSLSAFRNLPFILATLPLAFSLLNHDNDLEKIKHKKLLIQLIISILVVFTFLFTYANVMISNTQKQISKVADCLNENCTTNATFISSEEDVTSYLAYVSEGKLKPYIDNRLEVYSKKINGVYDYLNEYITLGRLKVIEKYKIDYYVVNKDNFNESYLLNNGKVIFNDNNMMIINYSWK